MDTPKNLPLPHELSPQSYVIGEEIFRRLSLQYGEDFLLRLFEVDTLVVRNLKGTLIKTLTRPV